MCLFLHLFLIRDDVSHLIALGLVGEVVAQLRDGRSMLRVVEMCVDSLSRHYRGMTQELLDVLHQDASVPEYGRPGMP